LTSVDFSGATALSSIGDYAFFKPNSNTSTSVIFSKKPTIGNKAFDRAYAGTISGPNAYTYCLRTPDSSGHVSAAALDGVTEIGSSGDYTGFYGCSALTSIEIPASVNTIHGRAFYNSGLTSITILGDSVSYSAQVFASSAKTLSQICGYPPPASLAISSQSGQCTNGWCASGSGWNTGDGNALNDIECTNAFSTGCPKGEYYTAGSAVADATCTPCIWIPAEQQLGCNVLYVLDHLFRAGVLGNGGFGHRRQYLRVVEWETSLGIRQRCWFLHRRPDSQSIGTEYHLVWFDMCGWANVPSRNWSLL